MYHSLNRDCAFEAWYCAFLIRKSAGCLVLCACQTSSCFILSNAYCIQTNHNTHILHQNILKYQSRKQWVCLHHRVCNTNKNHKPDHTNPFPNHMYTFTLPLHPLREVRQPLFAFIPNLKDWVFPLTSYNNKGSLLSQYYSLKNNLENSMNGGTGSDGSFLFCLPVPPKLMAGIAINEYGFSDYTLLFLRLQS